MADFDYVIVGGGSAGCVLANRLSARSANRVLLIEAGEDTPPGAEPAEILDSFPGYAYLSPRFHWGEMRVNWRPSSHNHDPNAPPVLKMYEQARVLGGGSSINGQLANRGLPSDYDEWAQRGAEGWDWDGVLPYFRKCERDLQFDGPLHGQDGPLPVWRLPKDRWSGHAKAIEAALSNQGSAYIEDQNGVFSDGHFPLTSSNEDGHRVSTAMAFLDEATRRRPNLTLLTQTHVTELIFEDRRCVGVKAQATGAKQTFTAGEVILSSGALQSPAHLLRAGIGPGGDLQALGIPVRHALAGVGQRLMEHPAVAIAAFLKPAARMNGRTRRHHHLGVRYSSGVEGVPPGDMFVLVTSKSAWHAVGDQLGTTMLFVNKTYSETGQVTLASPDPRQLPKVEFNLLSDWRDVQRLKDGVRRVARLYADPAVAAVTDNPFPASYSDRVRQVGAVTLRNKALTGAAARLLDGPGWLRKWMMDRFILEGFTLRQVLDDDDALEAFVRKAVTGTWHASASCRMGAADDPLAVVDNAGRVRGTGGLRVVDASIMPTVPCANLNLPVIMCAEKIADAVLEGR